ncbi:hypothetical protein CBS101457_003371 [Exobasidium rhododendri]|nr:hypothetical protein CBS101457_003371 [Exobasidium rhododendri]
MSTTRQELLIEVYTDPMCPWCWIGHARLEQTLQSNEFKEEIGTSMKPVVKLRPYILDNRLPATSFTPPSEKYVSIEATNWQVGAPPTKKEYYSKKFTNLEAFDAKISKAAKEVNLSGFEWLTEGKVGATWLAHRLLWYALQQDENGQQHTSDDEQYQPALQERLALRLYEAFHQHSQDLSNVEVLAEIAVVAELFKSISSAREWLQSDDGDYEVNQAADVGLMNGVMSVPFLIVQDGSDHSSEVMDHAGLMRMFRIQAEANR